MTDNEALLAQDHANRERLSRHDFDRNFLVSAGAGAGKTYLTVERAFNLLCDPSLQIKPSQIVLITFTRKAATEMKSRLSQWIRQKLAEAETGEQQAFLQELLRSLPEMQISTIHSFCQTVLSDYPLEAGIGFAPKFDSEDGGPDSRIAGFFDMSWRMGRLRESENAGIKPETAYSAFVTLNGKPTVQPQYVDPDTDEGREFSDTVVSECDSLVRLFRNSIGSADPGILHYRLENVIRAGDDPSIGTLLAAASHIAKYGMKARKWMGKNASKTAGKACEELEAFIAGERDPAAVDTVEAIFAEARTSKADRHTFVMERLPMLPENYRIVAEAVDYLPDEDVLKSLAERINLMMHGILTKETLNLCKEFTAFRRNNHIITTDDMLYLTAELVKTHPEVREKLHQQYRVFFVDEYQDTDPIQTDIVFAITAEKYDPDWHKCQPSPGSLFLVGDAKQGIYRFRGADISLWQEAEEVIAATGGEVVSLYQNFRSTPEVCDAVAGVFGEGGPLQMNRGPYQAGFSGMVAHRDHGETPVYLHEIKCGNAGDGHEDAAKQIAQLIRERVEKGQNRYEDFLLLSFNRERNMVYSDTMRKQGIPVKFDGALPIDDYMPIQLLNLRVQAVCHPFDEELSFRVLCICGNVYPLEWDLFRMQVQQLPEETGLPRYRDTRSLMGHVEKLAELLPDTEVNRRILKALAMLDRDRQLSQSRTPCAFLETLLERSEGIFMSRYGTDEFQNQVAALLQIIDSIRAQNPQQFVDMAELMRTAAESPMDRMPSVRADSNFVRLMNLHKAKGLQGKIVIFLPDKESNIKVDSHIRREDDGSLGWFEFKEDGNYMGVRYAPPDWKDRSKEETEFLKAERVRLKYVALTRAEDEVYLFTLRVEESGKKPSVHNVWSGFETVAKRDKPIAVMDAEPRRIGVDSLLATEVQAKEKSIREKIPQVTAKQSKRVVPSDLDKNRLQSEPVRVETETDSELPAEPFTTPGGTLWGTIVHRAAELIVRNGLFTNEAVQEASTQAVAEQIQSELLSDRDRKSLILPDDCITIEQIRSYLVGHLCSRLHFMSDSQSSFQQQISNAERYPELPFVLSVEKGSELFSKLASLVSVKDEKRIDISGKIDLALRFRDGTWKVIDYKTDRMLPEDGGSREVFETRLNTEYGAQIEMYRIVLEYLTGESVSSASIVSV